jgi:hypothetical protein
VDQAVGQLEERLVDVRVALPPDSQPAVLVQQGDPVQAGPVIRPPSSRPAVSTLDDWQQRLHAPTARR